MNFKLFWVLAAAFTILAVTSTAAGANSVKMTVGGYRFSDAVSVGDRYHAVDVTVQAQGVREQGIVELGLVPERDYLAFVSGAKTCDSLFSYNVHREYLVSSYDFVKFTLTGHNIPDGTYRAYLAHATGCWVGGGELIDPNKYVILKEPVVFGRALANVADQCDEAEMALNYLMSKGDLSCRVAVCDEPASSSSTARCVNRGECNAGAVQSVTCSDGGTIDVRQCVDAVWVGTGKACAAFGGGVSPLPEVPEPPAIPDLGGFSFGDVPFWVYVAGAVGLFFIARKFGVVKFGV